MFFRSETWGHVAFSATATDETNAREEGLETAMMQCRHGKLRFADPQKLPGGFLHHTHEIVHNPATSSALDEFLVPLKV